jgi:c-di-GMP-binding flagellar brake protein YcgR
MITQLLRADPDEDSVVVDYGASRPANLLLVQRRAVLFHCESGHHHVQFPALHPRQTLHDGRSAIRMDFPEYLLQHPHRSHPRFRIPPELRLKCVVECPGVISFEMDVRDISRGGLGMVTHGHDIRLEPGDVLRGCLIRHPLHRPIRVDLEIRHSTIAHLPDGGTTVRTGCRLIGGAAEIAELAGMFSVDLDGHA